MDERQRREGRKWRRERELKNEWKEWKERDRGERRGRGRAGVRGRGGVRGEGMREALREGLMMILRMEELRYYNVSGSLSLGRERERDMLK